MYKTYNSTDTQKMDNLTSF